MHIFTTMSLCGPNISAVGQTRPGAGDQVRVTDQVILSPWLVSAPSVVDTLWEGLRRNIKNLTFCPLQWHLPHASSLHLLIPGLQVFLFLGMVQKPKSFVTVCVLSVLTLGPLRR